MLLPVALRSAGGEAEQFRPLAPPLLWAFCGRLSYDSAFPTFNQTCNQTHTIGSCYMGVKHNTNALVMSKPLDFSNIFPVMPEQPESEIASTLPSGGTSCPAFVLVRFWRRDRIFQLKT